MPSEYTRVEELLMSTALATVEHLLDFLLLLFFLALQKEQVYWIASPVTSEVFTSVISFAKVGKGQGFSIYIHLEL